MSSGGLVFREASLADVAQVVQVTNEAFVADAFFKKPAYHQRFTAETVAEMMSAEKSAFILASAEESPEEVVGSIFVHWDVASEDGDVKVTGKFSAVSVPSRYGKRGIGKGLVRAVESKILTVAHKEAAAMVVLQMGVINLREDLFPWYESQGFRRLHEIRPNDPEVELITLDELKDQVCCVLMEKELR